MRSAFTAIVAVLIGAAALAIVLSAFIVNQSERALVLQFGEPIRVISEPGLYWRRPFIQNIVYFDKRILDLETDAQEVIASDQKRLVVEAFARYRIIDPLAFYRAFGNETNARARLTAIVDSTLRSVLGRAAFIDVVRNNREGLMRQTAQQVTSDVRNLGIEIVDVRIKRADLPESNSLAIYKRMQTARQREAAELRAQGVEQSQRIRSNADRQVTVLIAEANRDAERLRGEGDSERTRIYAAAFARDPDFFSFYRSMQAYEEALKGNGTRILLSPTSEFFRYFNAAGGSSPTGETGKTGQPGQGQQPQGSGAVSGLPQQVR